MVCADGGGKSPSGIPDSVYVLTDGIAVAGWAGRVDVIGRNMSRRSTTHRSVANYRQRPTTRRIVLGHVALSPRKTRDVPRKID